MTLRDRWSRHLAPLLRRERALRHEADSARLPVSLTPPLLDRARRGERAAFEELVRVWYPFCVRQASALVDRAVADSVVLEAFTDVYHALPAIRSPRALQWSLVGSIALHTAEGAKAFVGT